MSSRENTPVAPSTRSTRSGRRVREPVRYEPDPSVILEDDFSDCSSIYESDNDSYIEELDEDDYVSEIGDSDSESEDESEDSMSEDDDEEEPLDEIEEDDEDVIDFDCLTDNASDGSYSSEDED